MIDTDRLLVAAQGFAEAYHANARLCAGQADWNCSICLKATDTGRQLSINIIAGRIVSIQPHDENCRLTVCASQQILLDILERRLNPNQPYLFGELTVAGAEADFMRIDYVATMLCGP